MRLLEIFILYLDKTSEKKYSLECMHQSVTVNALAKINLGLQVLPKRNDGYHNLVSIFTTVNVADSITVALTENKNTCSVECSGMELPLENTFTKSYKAFCVLTGADCGCYVKVTKRIPSGGGLGGGSSDSSTFLKSIDNLCGTNLSDKAMLDIAGQVGSDCYFFTYSLLAKKETERFTAVVTGRGEKVRQIASRNDYFVLLVFPNVFVSTKEAYSLVDEYKKNEDVLTGEQLEKIYDGPIEKWNFVNDFTVPVCNKFPEVAEALADIKKTGALFADMSGSGSTVYGVFLSKENAVAAKETLSKKWNVMLAF